MNIKVLSQEENYLELELEGADGGFANALRELLIGDKNVTFAAVRVDHPQVSNPCLMVRTKSGSPLIAIKEAARRVRKLANEFADEAESAKKPVETKKKK